MRSIIRWTPALLAAALLSGCATNYRPIAYDRLDYAGQQETNGLAIAYRYDAQPGHYGNKARARGFSIVAVEVTNTTETPITVDRNTLAVSVNGQSVLTLAPEVVSSNTKQAVLPYALWGLLWFTVQENGKTTLALPIGVPIAALNMITSASSNGRAERSYREGHLYGRRVAPGETVHGLVFLHSTNYAPLTFEYRPPASAPVAAPAAAPAAH